jgi:type III restriction enzyme
MFQLKHYQQATLDALRGYFQACVQVGNPNLAFYQYTLERYGAGVPYRDAPGLPGPPYVCLRIPTGGGKTLVASHAVGVAARDLLQADHVVVLWLVPSNVIRDQTIQALKDRQHPYRQALDVALGAVTVLDVAEALYVQPPTLATTTTIIVATMQAFRVEDTDGRRVYEEAGALMTHFAGETRQVFQNLSGLERRADGSVVPSLANVLCLHRPIVVVDEAHNARTPLSFETLSRFNPSCILEFTATPSTQENPSNVLHSVSAAELHAEDMVKLPIRLETRPDWKALLADAVAQLDALQRIAEEERQQTGEYLRPIMLLQAEKRYQGKETIHVNALRACLMDDFSIPEAQIRRATGDYAELDDVDLADPACPVRYIITVQQLREGWDCPFAYVLCSVAEMSSSTAVEQILGRVMRLPHVQRKQRDELNKAYAFAASPNFAAAAQALADALVQNGFERHEVKDYIERAPRLPEFAGPLFEALSPDTVSFVAAESPALYKLHARLAAKVAYDADTHTLVFRGVMQEDEREALKQCFAGVRDRQEVDGLYRRSHGKATAVPVGSPARRRLTFAVPLLAIQQGNLFEPLEKTHIMAQGWRLSRCAATLSAAEFPAERPQGQVGEITIDAQKGTVRTNFLTALHQQMTLLAADHGWTEATLVTWLDRTLPNRQDVTPEESRAFLARLVLTLVKERGLTLDQLVHDKYRLRNAVIARIAGHRAVAYRQNLQALFQVDSPTPVAVTPGVCFTFDPQRYPYTQRYTGTYQFQKHYYDEVGNLKSSGEEFECAYTIDTLAEVDFWVRNPERPPNAFWLPTSGDNFYPDFVCKLKDGRYLVVEYKGAHLWEKEAEKRLVGEVWERQSGGTCLFVMLTERQFEHIRAKIHS